MQQKKKKNHEKMILFGKVCNKVDRWIKEYLHFIPQFIQFYVMWRVCLRILQIY